MFEKIIPFKHSKYKMKRVTYQIACYDANHCVNGTISTNIRSINFGGENKKKVMLAF